MKIILQRTDDAFQFEAKNEEGYAVNFDLNQDDGEMAGAFDRCKVY